MSMQNFWGVKEVLYGVVQVVNYVLLRHNDLIRDEIRVIAPHTETKKLTFLNQRFRNKAKKEFCSRRYCVRYAPSKPY